MTTIEFGNLNKKVSEHAETKGWIIGHFINSQPFFKTDDFEVKWSVHSKGDVKQGIIAKSSAKTLVILIKGKIAIRFPELNKGVLLSKMGDYVAYDAHEVLHSSESLEDTTILLLGGRLRDKWFTMLFMTEHLGNNWGSGVFSMLYPVTHLDIHEYEYEVNDKYVQAL